MSVRSYDLCSTCKNIQRGDAGTVGTQLDLVKNDMMAYMIYVGNISALKDHGRNSSTCDCLRKLEHAVSRL